MGEGPMRITPPLLDVLTALIEAGDELHGWAIMKATGRAGPTIYKMLERLTAAGWVEARWEDLAEDVNRPRRRLYRLTALGAGEARQILMRRADDPARRRRPGWA